VRSRRERQLEGWLKNIEQEFGALKASWRWRLGDRLVRLVERLLLRGRVPLAVDRIDRILEAFNESQRLALLEELQGRQSQEWQQAGHRAGRPMKSLKPVLETATAFARTANRYIESDAETGAALKIALVEGDEALSTHLRDLSDVETPLVSIILPTWQRENLVGEAIASVLEQSFDHWELWVCDDGSTDDTQACVAEFEDARIRYLQLEHAGAAAARNAGLARAEGDIIAYLDSDNLWHPHYLLRIVTAYLENPGVQAIACNYLDVEFAESGLRLRDRLIDYSWETLVDRNFIDLNSFSHRRALYDCMGGFTEGLPRRQDWDLLLKLLFRFDPMVVDEPLCLYRRHPEWQQLTRTAADRTEAANEIIQANLQRYFEQGVLAPDFEPRPRKVTVLVWDVCRNHLSKAWNVAEALSAHYPTQLIGFKFFGEEVFAPYRDADPSFETWFFQGSDFPAFADALGEALLAIEGDIIYCIKPRLPSLGLALLANEHFGTPFICESNDLESGVTRPGNEQVESVEPSAGDADFRSPWSDHWTRWLESLLVEWPYKATHNSVHDRYLGGGCFRIMNIKDEVAFEPSTSLRAASRRRLGIDEQERVLLFGGLVRRHKGVFELLEFVRDDRGRRPLRLLVVGSRASPELQDLKKQAGGRVTVLDARDRNEMAAINAAADAVLLWLNPATEAAHHQMPFKMTDAMAMEVPVLASPAGDLAELARKGLVKRVDFADTEALANALDWLQEDPEAVRRQTDAARRYYLRRFTYRAVREQFAVMERQIGHSGRTHPVASRFSEAFDDYLAGLA
jgi:glycosyltransferase involved in cell wall biosynthesis